MTIDLQDITVSVVTPYFNDSSRIKKTIDSVFVQTLSPLEMVIIDDCSEDSTILMEIVSNSLHSSKIIVSRNNTNKNGAFSRNRGVELSSGDFIAFLDADDYWLPNHLNESLSHLIASKSDFVYSNRVVFRRNLEERVIKSTNISDMEHNPSDILLFSPPQTNSFVFVRELYKYVRFDESLNRHQDYQFFLDAVNSDLSVTYVDINTSVYTDSHRSVASRIDFVSIFNFWESRKDKFTSDLLDKRLFKLLPLLLRYQPENINKYVKEYECLNFLSKRKDFKFFSSIGIVRSRFVFFLYIKCFFDNAGLVLRVKQFLKRIYKW
ncbi:glycosyltransferase family 2 protein [Vibrio breoganii]